MSKNPPSLGQVVAVVQSQLLPKRERDPRGRQPSYSDELIIGLVIFERVWGFDSSKKMLVLLASMGEQVPAEAT